MRRLMFSVLGFSLGILFLVSQESPLLLLGALSVLLFFLVYRLPGVPWRRALPYVLGGALFGLLYLTGYRALFTLPLEDYQGETLYLEGVVLDFPQFETYSYSVLVEARLEGRLGCKTLLYIDAQGKDLKPGDQIGIMGTLRSAETTFDGEAITYYTAKGILLRGTTEGVLTVWPAEGWPLKHLPAYLAQALKEGIYQVFSQETGAVIQALVTGNRDNLSQGFSTSLQRTGLAHTVAVSGMHLAFLAGMLRMFLPRGRRSSGVIMVLGIALFVLVSGSTPSILRAGIMVGLLQIAPFFGRERDDGTALALALGLILLWNPYTVNHVGLHLSFASVLGILLFSPGIQRKLEGIFPSKWGIFGRFVSSSLSATCGAMLITTPMVAYYFGSLSLIAPLANLMTLGVISFAFAGGMVAGVVGCLVPVLGRLLAYPVVPLVHYLEWAVDWLAGSSLAAISMDSLYYRYWAVYLYGIFFLWLLIPGKKRMVIPVCSCICSFYLAFSLHRQAFFQDGFSMQVLDVGQGQCVLMSLGEYLVVADCGGDSYQNAGDMAADAIQNLGRNSLELLILSHCHQDHAGGVTQLMDRIRVEAIAMPVGDMSYAVQRDICAKAQETATEIWFIQDYTRLELGNDQSIRLYPTELEGNDLNETGIISLISWEETDFLLTGDLSWQGEEDFVSRYPLPEVEFLMVGHHGSRYSSSSLFLETVSPAVGIISVGENNSYGHPTPETLGRMMEQGMEIYRTDSMGSFQVTA